MTDAEVRKIKYRWHDYEYRQHCAACLRRDTNEKCAMRREKKFEEKFGWNPRTLVKVW